MGKARTTSTWITVVLLVAMTAGYGMWVIMQPPTHWEAFLFVTLLFLLICAAVVRFVPYFTAYFARGTEPHLDRIGERTYRRCGVRELAKLVLLVLLLRLLQLIITYIIRLVSFGYTETFFTVQRIWLDFFHIEYSFPGYPLFSNLFWFFTFNFNHARFVASYVLTAVAAAAVYYWVLVDFDRSAARHTLVYFLLMPAACLLLGTLPDGMFVLCSMLSMLFVRRRKFILGNLFAMLAVTTHILGVLLFVPNIIEFTQMLAADIRTHQEEHSGYLLNRIISAMSFLLIPLGFALVLLYSRIRFGESTAVFRTAMDIYEYKLSSPFMSVVNLSETFLEALHTQDGTYLLTSLGNTVPNLFYLLLGAVMLVVAPGRIRTSYIAYMLSTYIAVLCTGTIWEAPRLLSLCVPFALTLALTFKHRWIHHILYLVCLAGFLIYLWAVVCGYTMYGA